MPTVTGRSNFSPVLPSHKYVWPELGKLASSNISVTFFSFAPSNNAVIGRYILPITIFKKLQNLKPGNGGEFHITDAIQSLINDGEKFIGHNFTGKYLDCGTMKGYIKSTMEIAKI